MAAVSQWEKKMALRRWPQMSLLRMVPWSKSLPMRRCSQMALMMPRPGNIQNMEASAVHSPGS